MTINYDDVARANVDDVLPAINVDSFSGPDRCLVPAALTRTRSHVPVSLNTELSCRSTHLAFVAVMGLTGHDGVGGC